MEGIGIALDLNGNRMFIGISGLQILDNGHDV
jgi:hypothetical protein